MISLKSQLSDGPTDPHTKLSSTLHNKTLQVGPNPSVRVCHKHEHSISPTITLNDKKGYQVASPIDAKISEAIAWNRQQTLRENEYM